jgi:hypothetical protein
LFVFFDRERLHSHLKVNQVSGKEGHHAADWSEVRAKSNVNSDFTNSVAGIHGWGRKVVGGEHYSGDQSLHHRKIERKSKLEGRGACALCVFGILFGAVYGDD